MTQLNGLRVLITGATSGLGSAMASALVNAGARVLVSGRDQGRADAAARALGSPALGCQLDVRDERSVAACVRRAEEAWGGLDMLVNNAGIGMRTVNPRFLTEPQSFWHVTPAGFRDVVDTTTWWTPSSPVAFSWRARWCRACSGKAVAASSTFR
jgi:gluconate 5-dehydrogenase